MNDALPAIAEAVLCDLRLAGLYEESVMWHPDEEGGKFVLALTLYVGDVAFSARVQDVTQQSIDEEFAELSSSLVADAFQDVRKQILAGEWPLG